MKEGASKCLLYKSIGWIRSSSHGIILKDIKFSQGNNLEIYPASWICYIFVPVSDLENVDMHEVLFMLINNISFIYLLYSTS